MSCPTCDHTMQNLGVKDAAGSIFWCPRCGTLKMRSGDYEEVELPIWLRHLVHKSGVVEGKQNVYQHSTVRALFQVHRNQTEPLQIQMEIEK